MFTILVALFTIVPALEIYLLIKIGGAIGGINTILVVITTGILGAGLAKSQGLTILNKIQTDLTQGKLPADQLIHGLLVFGGGLLLLTPGFFTDFLGLSMVFPGSRHFYVALLKSKVQKGLDEGTIQFTSFNSSGFSGFSGGFSNQAKNEHNPFEQFDKQDDQKIHDQNNVIEADFKKKD